MRNLLGLETGRTYNQELSVKRGREPNLRDIQSYSVRWSLERILLSCQEMSMSTMSTVKGQLLLLQKLWISSKHLQTDCNFMRLQSVRFIGIEIRILSKDHLYSRYDWIFLTFGSISLSTWSYIYYLFLTQIHFMQLLLQFLEVRQALAVCLDLALQALCPHDQAHLFLHVCISLLLANSLQVSFEGQI